MISFRHGWEIYLHLLLSNGIKKINLICSPALKSKFFTLFAASGQLGKSRWASGVGLRTRAGFLVVSRGFEPGNFALKTCSAALDLWNGRAAHGRIVKGERESRSGVGSL
ncbi:tetratricopeptide repeat protein [Striga asiatica]|uniref:Tetratricopeptide repeat protein n=1 Tax=Striga asiatica TaxID=4170 RepID=A0A5A7RKH2_STRAF|nr:tetratricopeptide repeat protein [Striga asiatica]